MRHQLMSQTDQTHHRIMGRHFFVVVTGETHNAHEGLIQKLEKKRQKKKESVEESDYILAFCPSPSRTGTDITEAMRKIPNGKPVILVVMHHRNDVPAYLRDSSRHVSRDVRLSVDTLFWEGKFLKCPRNDEAFSEVQRTVHSLKKTPPAVKTSKKKTTAQPSPSGCCLIL